MSVESLISCPKMNLKGDFSDTPPRERLAHKYPAAVVLLFHAQSGWGPDKIDLYA